MNANDKKAFSVLACASCTSQSYATLAEVREASDYLTERFEALLVTERKYEWIKNRLTAECDQSSWWTRESESTQVGFTEAQNGDLDGAIGAAILGLDRNVR